jgi:uncharacterized protein YyaL (SSP411 family)
MGCAGHAAHAGGRDPGAASGEHAEPSWREWGPEAFAEARESRKLLLVSVQAGWCHWCHVMNAETFADADVLALLDERYVVIRVEADARPDLAERYAEYGWPATALLTPDAEPILALRGFRPPDVFARILRQAEEDVAAGRVSRAAEVDRAATAPAADLEQARLRVREQLDGLYDDASTGWGRRQKYPFPAPLEHAFLRGITEGDSEAAGRALRTAESHALLLDPVFGGMYQYSTQGDWDHPHFEKIAAIQAGAIRNFVSAYAVTGDVQWLDWARSVARYVREFLEAPEGGYYTSQDADVPTSAGVIPGAEYYALDDEARRARGLPRTDTHVYASHNGLLIDAMARLAEVDPEGPWLESALSAARAIERTHRRGEGYVHAPMEPAEPAGGLMHLADQAFMARALATLAEASGDPAWLALASRTVAFAEAELRSPEGGCFAHTPDPTAVGVFARRGKPLEQNAVLAQVMLELAHRQDDEARHARALELLRDIARPAAVARQGRKVGELALALERARWGHILLSVVGPADHPATEVLHRAALAFQYPGRLVELGRPGQSRYPYPGEPSMYLCSGSACSMPLRDPALIAERARGFAADLRE